MKFLVTGSAGFIGSHLVLHLLSLGHTVIGIDNMSGGFAENITVAKESDNAENYTFIKIDITDYDSLNDIMKGIDYVLHQAAWGSVPRSLAEPESYNLNNINGTFNVLKAARDNKVKRVVFASSSSVYGDTLELPKHEGMLPRPLSPYALSKLTGEHYCKIFSLQYGLETVSLRYFNIFGPRQNPKSQYAAVIPKFLNKIYNSESPEIYGDGDQSRDFTFITNVINANFNACFSKDVVFGDAYNIGCGDRISINKLTNEMKKLLSKQVETIYTEIRKGDVRDSLASIDKATAAGLIKDPIGLNEGLALTVAHFLNGKSQYE